MKSKTLNVHTFNNHHPDRQKGFEFARRMVGWVGLRNGWMGGFAKVDNGRFWVDLILTRGTLG